METDYKPTAAYSFDPYEEWALYRKRVEALACGDALDLPKHKEIGVLLRDATFFMDHLKGGTPTRKWAKQAFEDLVAAGIWLQQCPDWGNKQPAVFLYAALVEVALEFLRVRRKGVADRMHHTADLFTRACHAN